MEKPPTYTLRVEAFIRDSRAIVNRYGKPGRDGIVFYADPVIEIGLKSGAMIVKRKESGAYPVIIDAAGRRRIAPAELLAVEDYIWDKARETGKC